MQAFRRSVVVAAAAASVSVAVADCSAGDEVCQEESEESTLLALRLHQKDSDLELDSSCPISGTACSEEQCCPGIAATGYRTFPCPSTPTYTGCAGSENDLHAAVAAEKAGQAGESTGSLSLSCPGSPAEVQCSRNSCCPGITATSGKSFPCPNSDRDFVGCQGSQDDTVKALLSAMTRDEKYQFLRGFGWKNNTWDVMDNYYIGNAAAFDTQYTGKGTSPSKYGIPPLNMQDNGQGFRTVTEQIIEQVTGWPVTLAIASSWDEQATYDWAVALGEEFLAKGANVILGPGVNVHRVARGGRNGEYVSGESPYFGARMAKPYVEGVQSKGVLAVAKHFALNSQETHRDTVNSMADERTMQEVYYPPFKACVDAGAASFMCSYNLVNGVHACGNSDLLNRDLKEDMGFKGWVMSDWWALHDFKATEGVDQEMPGTFSGGSPAYYGDSNLNTLSDDKIDNMVERMLSPMLKFGLFEAHDRVCSPPNCDDKLYKAVATNEKHQQLAKELAHKAVVLLKNEDNFLPLDQGKQKIALLGEGCNAAQDVASQLKAWDVGSYYNIGGSGRVIASNPETVHMGLSHACEKFGCTLQTYFGTDVDEAVAASEGADVVIMCSGTSSTEGKDRESLSVDHEDFMVQLADKITDKPLVSLTMTPAVVLMPWIDSVTASLNVFLAGTYTGSAFAATLFGENNPAAKLVITIPESEDQTILPCQEVDCPYTEKLKVGYLALLDQKVTFPFGHGLSYTTFGYTSAGSPSTEKCSGEMCISAVIKNTGEVEGVEIAQLYLTFPNSAEEPPMQLRGFVRTKSLAPDASADISFTLTKQDLSIYDVEKRAWVMPSGTYTVSVGASSRDIRFSQTFTK